MGRIVARHPVLYVYCKYIIVTYVQGGKVELVAGRIRWRTKKNQSLHIALTSENVYIIILLSIVRQHYYYYYYYLPFASVAYEWS